jgi:hypothetical protein
LTVRWRDAQLSINLARLPLMECDDILMPGEYELVKAGFHGTALGLAVVMGAYNAAAWFRRRERHLAINAVLYAVVAAWEHQHVSHHVASLRLPREVVVDDTDGSGDSTSSVAA